MAQNISQKIYKRYLCHRTMCDIRLFFAFQAYNVNVRSCFEVFLNRKLKFVCFVKKTIYDTIAPKKDYFKYSFYHEFILLP